MTDNKQLLSSQLINNEYGQDSSLSKIEKR